MSKNASLRRRLPLLILALLAAIGLAFAWMAYREVERALKQYGDQRLKSATEQLAGILTQSAANRLADARRLAASPPLQRYLADRTDSARVPAEEEMQAFVAQSPQSAVAVYDAAGRRIGRFDRSGGALRPPFSSQSNSAMTAGVSPLRAERDQIAYSTISPVEDAHGLVEVERTLASSDIVALIERLIGAGAIIKLGNSDGTLWTDLSRRIEAPPVTGPAVLTTYRDAEGRTHRGTAVAVPSTPWLVWLEFSEDALLEPARILLGRMLPVAALLIVLGALAVRTISGRITKPILALTKAAEGIAAGQYERRVPTERTDEIGRLGVAFNTMAERVADAHHVLEQRVEERTRELKAAQEELVRRERLATLGQLASSVGHELRNPLGVMTNAIYYLEMIQADAPPEVREYLDILRHQIALSEKIVGDLLDFARLRTPDARFVAVPALLDEQIARLGPLDGIDVWRECEAGVPPVWVDPVQIGQVLLNLLTNAAQSMERGGTLTLRCRADERSVTIDVSDTGPGVPGELAEKIFEPLFTTKARGIGLGLVVSRSLTGANRGRLTVSTNEAGGATFSLTLPISPDVPA